MQATIDKVRQFLLQITETRFIFTIFGGFHLFRCGFRNKFLGITSLRRLSLFQIERGKTPSDRFEFHWWHLHVGVIYIYICVCMCIATSIHELLQCWKPLKDERNHGFSISWILIAKRLLILSMFLLSPRHHSGGSNNKEEVRRPVICHNSKSQPS